MAARSDAGNERPVILVRFQEFLPNGALEEHRVQHPCAAIRLHGAELYHGRQTPPALAVLLLLMQPHEAPEALGQNLVSIAFLFVKLGQGCIPTDPAFGGGANARLSE